MVVAAPAPAGELHLAGLSDPVTRSGSPAAAALAPAAADWQLPDHEACATFAASCGGSPSTSDPDAVMDGISGWGEDGFCHSGLPLSVPLPAAVQAGHSPADDCSWDRCSPAEDGTLPPPASLAGSRSHEVLT
jgi:hypothetical protein